MATVIVTSSASDLNRAAQVQEVATEMERSIPEAGAERQKVAMAVNELELAAVEVPKASEASKQAEADRKSSTSRLRDSVFGMVAFVEMAYPQLKSRLPILSRFDLVTAYVLIDEMTVLFSGDPKLAPLVDALVTGKTEHLRVVEAAMLASRRKLEAGHRYKVARETLKKVNQEARLFVLNHSAPDSEWVARLKKPSTRKPAKKKEQQPKQEQPADVKPAANLTPVAA